MKIATAGSCFAQHIGRTLRENDSKVIDLEPFVPGFSDTLAQRFGHRLYSARYGNIYTIRQFWQLLREAFGHISPAHPVWEKDGRFFDAFRPSVEPDGLPTARDVVRHRENHLKAVRTMIARADLMVFTFGLTEAWACRADGTVYPTAPGTLAGSFDAQTYHFMNFGHAEVMQDFKQVRQFLKEHNPEMKFLVTVSPVPLTATASGQHVEVATSYSKSTLRSVCGELSQKYADVDYFPSYEIITSQKARAAYFAPNLRTVNELGVATAMQSFLQAHGIATPHPPASASAGDSQPTVEDLVCEDALLDAFAK
jgi:hypothetical protein